MRNSENVKEYMQIALLKLADLVLYLDTGERLLLTEDDKYIDFFGVPPTKYLPAGQMVISVDRVHPDDRDLLLNCLNKSLQIGCTDETVQTEFRAVDGCGKYNWIRLTLIPMGKSEKSLCGADVRPYRYILCLNNITPEKRRTMALIDAVKRDAYTDLFNKKHTKESVEKLLAKNRRGALFLIDIDDFKGVNDSLGHLLGDVVILNMANKLKGLFGSPCVLGRVGGDEFLGYLPECGKREAEETAKRIMNTVRQITYGTVEKNNITCSVGISMYPRDANDYNSLYEKADLASYMSKSGGKDKYNFYNAEMSWDNVSYNCQREDNTTGNLMPPMVYGTDFIEYVYRILDDCDYSENAIGQALTLAAQRFGAVRTFYVRYCEGRVKLEFEWTHDGDSSKVYDVLPRFETDTYLKNYQGNGIYYRSDVSTAHPDSAELLERAGIKSLMHCAVLGDSGVEGFIAFESPTEWSDEELMLLGFVSKIITENIKYRDNRVKSKAENDRLKNILNATGKMVYTIDVKTHNIVYVNDVMKSIFPHAQTGKKCYKILCDNELPCTDCPLKAINGGLTAQHSYSITNSTCVKANFSLMDMAGKSDKEALCWAELSIGNQPHNTGGKRN